MLDKSNNISKRKNIRTLYHDNQLTHSYDIKRVFVITIFCTAGIYASGQVLAEISTEAGKLCKELTSVNRGIGRIQGILNIISDCTSDLNQVSARSNKLSLTPTNKVQAPSKLLAA